jgi:hypothetical protein
VTDANVSYGCRQGGRANRVGVWGGSNNIKGHLGVRRGV